jgi:hypothetical protein
MFWWRRTENFEDALFICSEELSLAFFIDFISIFFRLFFRVNLRVIFFLAPLQAEKYFSVIELSYAPVYYGIGGILPCKQLNTNLYGRGRYMLVLRIMM